MNQLPVCFFTKGRTRLACFVMDQLRKNLSASGYDTRVIVCDDGSEPGHADALAKHAGSWLHSALNVNGRGLGASMNAGLKLAFRMSDVVLRMEDDWVLEKPLDVGRWADTAMREPVACVRLGMLHRDPEELVPFGGGSGLLRVVPKRHRIYNVNNQVALVHRRMHDLVGFYREGIPAQDAEFDFARRFNAATKKGTQPPWVCWPAGWTLGSYDDPGLHFIHAGKSTLGHRHYVVPERYRKYND